MSEGFAQGLYMMARVKFELATFSTKGKEPTTEPPRPVIQRTYIACQHGAQDLCPQDQVFCNRKSADQSEALPVRETQREETTRLAENKLITLLFIYAPQLL